MKKIVSATNLTHKQYGLERVNIIQHNHLTAMIYNFRKTLSDLGYDISLLNDSEVLAFEEEIYLAEQSEDYSYLSEILEFLS